MTATGPIAVLHIPPILPAHLEQRIRDPPERADAHGVHQHFEHVLVFDHSALKPLRSQLSHVWHVPHAGRANLSGRQRYSAARRSVIAHKLDLVRFAVAENVHYHADVPGDQAQRRNVRNENNR